MAIGNTLKNLGFDVDVVTDATKQTMEDALARLAQKARNADVTVIFYAGHGLQDQGKNYFAPVDATLADETDLRRSFVRLDDVLDDLAGAKGARILLLDACRDNGAVEALRAAVPKSRSAGISRGLARIPEAQGQLVAFATQPDRVAGDGEGADSPFTTALISHLGEPGVELRTALTRVRVDVAKATNNDQIPEVSDSLLGEVYLQPLSATAAPPSAASTPPVAPPPPDQAAWERIGASTDPVDFESFARVFPDSAHKAEADAKAKSLRPKAEPHVAALTSPAEEPAKHEVAPTPPATTGSTPDEEAALQMGQKERRKIQIALAGLGFDPGLADGNFNNATRVSIRSYQYSIEHNPTGYLNRTEYELLLQHSGNAELRTQKVALRLNAAELPEGTDPRLLKAIEVLAGYPVTYGTFEGKLYLAVVKEGTWQDARELAHQAGGDLASLKTKQASAFAYGLVSSDPHFWTIDTEKSPNSGYFASGPQFGLVQNSKARSSDAGWEWVDGSPLRYSNWNSISGQPNEYKLNHELGAGAFGGRNPRAEPIGTWQDHMLFSQTAPSFIMEIGATAGGQADRSQAK